jgi:hypothetical protein
MVVGMDISYRAAEPNEVQEYRDKLFGGLWELTRRLADMDVEAWPEFPDFGGWTPTERRDAYLALLNAIGTTYALLDFYEKETANRAGRLGAGYPELAEAWQITRQGARRRWPDAVVTDQGDYPLRRALTKVVQMVSNSQQLDPRTAARLIGPVTAAASAQVHGSAEEVREAARRIVEAPTPAPPDALTVSPLIDELEAVLDEYDSGKPAVSTESSPWSRFLEARQR